MSTVDQIVTNPQSPSALSAKKNLKKFVVKIDKKLEEYFDSEIKNSFEENSGEKKLSKHILEHIKEHNLRPAKRLRGSFVYYGYKLFGGKGEVDIIKAAMSIELIHTALLMHDDFIDRDDTRRGGLTTHIYYSQIHKKKYSRGNPAHYGDSMAVNAGNIALLSGFEILGRSNFEDERKLKAQNRLLRGIVNTGLGQAYDVTLEATGKATQKNIFDLHLAKTAIYTYENPLHIGAILAGAKQRDLDLLTQYAMSGGIAFQLQDDILGLYGNPSKTGKPSHSDLRQGKMTLLIVRALERGSPTQVRQLKKVWGRRNLSVRDAQQARKIVRETGSLGYSKHVSIKWAKKAQRTTLLMKKRKWNKEAVAYLEGIAQYMIERDV